MPVKCLSRGGGGGLDEGRWRRIEMRDPIWIPQNHQHNKKSRRRRLSKTLLSLDYYCCHHRYKMTFITHAAAVPRLISAFAKDTLISSAIHFNRIHTIRHEAGHLSVSQSLWTERDRRTPGQPASQPAFGLAPSPLNSSRNAAYNVAETDSPCRGGSFNCTTMCFDPQIIFRRNYEPSLFILS